MLTQSLLFKVALVIIVVLVGYILIPPYLEKRDAPEEVQQSAPGEVENAVETEDEKEIENETETEAESVADEEDTASVPEDKAVTAVPPVVPVAPVVEVTGYTAASVATHDSVASCWSIINGNVYDLTSFVDDHPGGEKNILKICGKDGTSAFMGQHGGDTRPEATLEGFLLGPLEG